MSEERLTYGEILHRSVARVLMRLPGRLQVLLSGGTPVRHGDETLHPEVQLLLAMRRWKKTPALSGLPPKQGRDYLRREALVHSRRKLSVGAVSDFAIPGPGGDLRVRHYVPPGVRARHPLMVYLHGGGFVLCDLDTHDAACRLLCRRARIGVLSVAYRLAPEFRFPAAIDDVYAAFRWARREAESLGADPERIALGGDSAGANLAAVVSQLLRDEGAALPALQLLLYPAVDPLGEYASLSHFAEGFLLTRQDMRWFQAHYASLSDPRDPRLHPLRGARLGGLPPAVVATAAFDPLRDEGEAYARALEASGTRVVCRRLPGMIHGFANLLDVSSACREALASVAELVRDELSRGPRLD